MIRVNGYLVEEITFPNGEVAILFPHSVVNEFDNLEVVVEINNSDDLVRFMLFQDMLYDNTTESHVCTLIFPFFPYSRADRKFDNLPYSLKTFCNTIILYFWDSVQTYDAHNPEILHKLLGGKFVNNMSKTYSAAQTIWKDHIKPDDVVCIVSPDEGAIGRTVDFFELIHDIRTSRREIFDFRIVSEVFEKVRDQDTGKILSIQPRRILTEADIYIVVDDICDAGGTFLGVAEHLPEGKKKILFVTHGYFSKGTELLTNAFDAVYTSDTIYKGVDEKVFIV